MILIFYDFFIFNTPVCKQNAKAGLEVGELDEGQFANKIQPLNLGQKNAAKTSVASKTAKKDCIVAKPTTLTGILSESEFENQTTDKQYIF